MLPFSTYNAVQLPIQETKNRVATISTLLLSPKQTEVAHNTHRFMTGIKKNLSLLDTLLSLSIDPAGMMRHLLRERRYPPYLVLAPLSTLLVIVAPSLWYQYSIGLELPISEIHYSTSLTVVLTLVWFCLLMSVLFKLLLLNVSPGKIWAASLYCIAGLIPFMLAFYLGNFLSSGTVSVLEFLAIGRAHKSDWFLQLFPNFAKVALVFSFLLFVNAVRALTNAKLISAFSMSLLALPVLIGSFVVSLTIADMVFPDTGVAIYRFFTQLFTPINSR